MPKIDVSRAPERLGTRYPAPFSEPCKHRHLRALGDAAGLTQFGVNLVRLPPGTWSSQRHWHSREDEFVYLLEGTAILVTDAGEETLGPGDCVGFRAGVSDGHCLQNRADRDVVFLVVGSRVADDSVEYPDVDLKVTVDRPAQKLVFTRKDGTPY
jgi:uncharacterized cupin superfamily protein